MPTPETLPAGWRELDARDLPDYDGRGVHLRHEATGAEVVHVVNDDPENAFCFGFRTVPSDSTGVAHILEHTVLCGSERFPIKDPFVQLLKGSVHTFLNAMTYPDRTLYPAASPVRADLFNMMDVYGDAVFFPLLRREHFDQEGHRVEFDGEGRLVRTGIVYNEMKGNYSSHDSVVGDVTQQALMPDTPYGFDSGGDPAAIPDLTHDGFVAFHRRTYHPANARILLYGDIPTNEYLAFLEERFLSRFGAGTGERDVPLQPRWSAPRTTRASYPADGVADLSERSTVTLSWLLFPVTEAERLLRMSVLTEALIGHSGAPLAKALIDSGLGQDLSPLTGLEADYQEAVFAAGLRGTEEAHAPAIERLVLETLASIARDGFDPETVEGAVRRIEFRDRELKSGPNGLRAMRRAYRQWNYGASPLAALGFTARLRALREELEANPRLFEELIERELLSNAHRLTAIVVPDSGLGARREADERAALDRAAAALSEDDRDAIRAANAALKRLQDEPDDPAALAAVPSLSLADIPADLRRIDHARESLPSGGELLVHEANTNGIWYVDLAFDVGDLTPDDELLLNLLGAAVTEVGLPDAPWYDLAGEINLRTGGLSAFVSHQTRHADLAVVRRLFVVRMRTLAHAWAEGASLLQRLLTTVDFADTDRLSQIVEELFQDTQSHIFPGGHHFAGTRAATALSPIAAIDERISGIEQYRFLEGIVAADAVAPLGARLASLLRRILDPARMHVHVTADGDTARLVRPWIDELAAALADGVPAGAQRGAASSASDAPAGIRGVVWPGRPRREYLLGSATVNYVAAAVPGARFGEPDAAAQDILAHVLSTGLLFEKVRMAGGAYGAFALSRTTEGIFGLVSYRDPRSSATLAAYRDALATLAAAPLPESELDQAKVSLLGRELRPLVPRDAGWVGFRRYLHDIDDELRLQARRELREATAEAVQRVAATLRDRMDDAYVAIVGGGRGLEELRGDGGPEPTVVELGL